LSDGHPNPCPASGRYDNRVMTVDAVVLDEGRVLLIRRKNEPFRDYWALPGGYMDFNETAQEAAHRELEEETGLTAAASIFVGLFDEPGRHPRQVVSAAFLVPDWEGELKAGDDAVEAAWFPVDTLPEQLAFDHRQIINQALGTE
jgi:8-oxo-dGTP diphosphatase